MDDDYPHLKLVNSFKKKFNKLQKTEAGMEHIKNVLLKGNATDNGTGQIMRNKNDGL